MRKKIFLTLSMIIIMVGLTSLCSMLIFRYYYPDDTIVLIKTDINELQNKYLFSNQQEFDKAIFNNIERYIQGNIQREINEKFLKYKNAEEQINLEGKHIYGNLSARFTLVVFSDFECPYCKNFHETPKAIVDASNGNVNWQWIHLPLSFHNPIAEKEAIASECIGEQKGNRGFWVFIDDLFSNTKGNGSGVPDLGSLVKGVGADIDLFKECILSEKYKNKIESDVQKATQLGVNSTPTTFIVDNYSGLSQVISGAQSPQAIAAIIKKIVVEAESKTN